MSELFVTGEHVSQLASHQGWLAVQRVLEGERETVDRFLDAAPRSHVEYAASHGYRRGLRAADDAMQAILAVCERRRTTQAQKHEGAAEPAPEE